MEDSNNFLENIGDIDGEQDIARSAYADMLHDIERNEKYEKAIAKVISQMKNKGISVNVLDIGTGTGLLSMMAAKHGADSIVACEAFTPVAECAVKVIEDNGYSASIKVIPKRSTDLIVGNDLPKKANLVVAELYDTELIGEGAILSYNHARKELLEEDFLSIPSRARIYAQLVECPLARSWNRPFSIEVTENDSIMPPPEAEICSGAPAVHDIQMSQLLSEGFTAITDPAEVFCFDWLSPYTPSTGHNVTNLKTIAPGSVNAVFFWWTTDMDPEGEIILSCAPVWAHPDAKKGLLPWRDHWMQAVYYLPNDVCASEIGVELVLEAFHDEYSLWFRLGERHHNNSPIAVKETRPICNCFLHLAYSRPRLGLLNDKTRQNKYINALKRYLFPGATVLSLGDGSWLSLIAAKLGATVIAIETNPMCRRVIESYSESNGLQNNLTILSGSIDKFSERSFDKKINFVIAEPFFEDSVLPWDHLYFWMEIKKIKSFLDPGMKVLPSRVKIKGLGVRFHDLHKIQTPIVETCGFSMKQFDDLIQEAIDSSDETIEPHPLWEYPCTALTDIVHILELSFALDDKSSHSNLTDVEVTATDEINGVVIWCEWFLDDDIVVSTGPRSPTNKGEVIHWDLHSKQGCHFLRNINNVNSWSRLQFLAMENDCEISIEINRI